MLVFNNIYKFFCFFCLIGNFLHSTFNYEKESDRILKNFIKDVRSSRLQPSGVGGGICGEINRVSVSLECYENLNLEQARNLYLTLYSKLLNSYNSNRQLRPYLHNYPFNSENIEISISFKKNNHKRVDSNFIAYTCCARGKIFYDFYDHEKRDLVTLHSEEISEALKNYNINVIIKDKK